MRTKTEAQRIVKYYEQRKYDPVVTKNNSNYIFNHYACCERELRYKKIIKSIYKEENKFKSLKFLEIGAGGGDNLFTFKRMGLNWNQIYANELIPDRYELLEKDFPNITLLKGDACEIDKQLHGTFNIILVSTVFSSILNEQTRQQLANKIWHLLSCGGIILFYDFIYNNPKNIHVRGIKKKEINSLFPKAISTLSYSVTLAPPIGRKVGAFYHFFNIFPFLRTYLITVLIK